MKLRFVFMLISLSACGRVGGIRPPEATAPAPVKFLTAEGRADGVLLRWQPPTEDASGGSLRSLTGYVIQRSDYHRGEVPDFSKIAEIVAPEAAEKKRREEAEGTVSDETKKPKESAFGFGPKTEQFAEPISFFDNTVEAGKRYDYRVLGVNESGVKGRADLFLRITFAGDASRIENIAVTLPGTKNGS